MISSRAASTLSEPPAVVDTDMTFIKPQNDAAGAQRDE